MHSTESFAMTPTEKTRLAALHERLRAKLAAKLERNRNRAPIPPPRCDEIYWEGVAFLDSLGQAEDEMPLEGVLVFSVETAPGATRRAATKTRGHQ